MTDRQLAITSLLAVLLTAGVLFYVAPDQSGDNLSGGLECVSRTTIIERGQNWVDKNVPYNQQGIYDGYRTDCTGFVSMTWGLPKPGLENTSILATVLRAIAKSDLMQGDAIICQGLLVILFAGWIEGKKSHYIGMQLANSQAGTIKRTIPYPYWPDLGCYHPVRYIKTC